MNFGPFDGHCMMEFQPSHEKAECLMLDTKHPNDDFILKLSHLLKTPPLPMSVPCCGEFWPF